MALMAATGEISPMPVAAIFADTQDEPTSVYAWLDWLETQLPFPVRRVTKGKLSEQALKMRTTKDGRSFTTTSIPYRKYRVYARGGGEA
jgi:3'-phosphoadenosine 5'-phosphosulfate sulfotransferase (PAPS reductase)/FAD synthetase